MYVAEMWLIQQTVLLTLLNVSWGHLEKNDEKNSMSVSNVFS